MILELKALAERIGIAEYPQRLEGAFEECRAEEPLRIEETLEKLQAELSLFGNYTDFLLTGARAVQDDRDLFAWLSIGLRYCRNATEAEAAAFPFPPDDGSLARGAFPALLAAMEFPDAVERYRARGLDDVQIGKNLGNLQENIRVCEITQGRVYLSAGLYAWVTHYLKARIFDYNGFNFQAAKCNDEAILLRHRERDEYAFLMCKGSFTAQGTLVGIRGAEDVPAFLEATVEETDGAFFGYRAIGQRVSTVRERFDKSEWETVFRPGDDVISFHIPRGADFTPAHVDASIAQGMALARRYYPECDFKSVVCTSWMIDPKLLEVLPEQSKIAHFIRGFQVRPSLDTAGNACMSYVFPGENGSIEELSEKTSLQRGIKRMMLDGNFIFWTTGAWVR